MIIYAMRHGEALRGASDDAGRILTSKGREQIREVCEVAKLLRAQPDVFISSPLERAKESAAIAKSILNPQGELLVDNCLEPEGEPAEIYRVLLQRQVSSALLVSHMPILGIFFANILGCSKIQIEPGTLARIDSGDPPEQDSGTLVWLIPPPQVKA
jgi:phosphohistidine phosphatase